jgi:hypothetical protein
MVQSLIPVAQKKVIDYMLIAITLSLIVWLSTKFRVVYHCKNTVTLAGRANVIVLSRVLSDLEKEEQTRHMAKQLIVQFGRVVLAGSGSFLLPLLPVYLLSLLGLVDLEQLLHVMLSTELLVLFILLSVISWWATRRG